MSSTVPVSARDAVPFTPLYYAEQKDRPTYLLKPTTGRLKARLRTEVMRAGLRHWSPAERSELIENELRELFGRHGDPAAAIDTLRRMEEAAQAENDLLAQGEKDPDSVSEAQLAAVRVDVSARVQAAEPVYDWLRRYSRAYCEMEADNAAYIGQIFYVQAAVHLAGWSGMADGEPLPPFEALEGVVPMELLDQLPERDIPAIGMELHRRVRLTETERKNSASPSGSDADQDPSAADASPTTAGPDGGSEKTGKSIPKTQS